MSQKTTKTTTKKPATTKLPSRPNLDQLRRQAKERLPALRGDNPAARLADAQLAVARETGFASWPGLARHVEALRGLEGDWRFTALEIDGAAMPPGMVAASRLLLDGDRFRMESPEATYEGVFTIDTDASPPHIDIDFIDGPEAGNRCEGLFELAGDALVLCLGLVGSRRPKAFATTKGSGHALERLRRVSAARPDNVTGGTPPAPSPAPAAARGDAAAFAVPMTALMRRLEGAWSPVELATDGKPMPDAWLAMGSRTATGNEVKVVFGGQTVVHAKVRFDESASPVAVDYLALSGKQAGKVTFGIMEWVGDEPRFLMAPAGAPRPTAFTAKRGTLSRWRKRAT